MKGDNRVENNPNEGDTSDTLKLKEDRKPFVHPLLIVVIFLFLLVIFAVFGLYTSLKEKTRPRSDTSSITKSYLVGSKHFFHPNLN